MLRTHLHNAAAPRPWPSLEMSTYLTACWCTRKNVVKDSAFQLTARTILVLRQKRATELQTKDSTLLIQPSLPHLHLSALKVYRTRTYLEVARLSCKFSCCSCTRASFPQPADLTTRSFPCSLLFGSSCPPVARRRGLTVRPLYEVLVLHSGSRAKPSACSSLEHPRLRLHHSADNLTRTPPYQFGDGQTS